MNFIMKNKYFVIFVLLTSQAFASLTMEEDQEFSYVTAMKSNLTHSRDLYKKCSFYKSASLMLAELQKIIDESAHLSSLPLPWQDRFIRHIVSVSSMDNEEFNLSFFNFSEYSKGCQKAYINGLCSMNSGLRFLYQALQVESAKKHRRPMRYYGFNTAVDADHWTRTDG